MKRIDTVLKGQFKLKVRRIIDKAVKEIVALEVIDFGILITKESSITDEKNYRCIYVNGDKLDEQVYVASLNKEILWELIKAGYLRKLRLEHPGAFKAMIVGAGWGLKIIDKRLSELENRPRNRFEISMNEEYKKNFTRSFMEDPGFFDKL